ncbi:MAG: SLC13 family permease [Guyparkeria sp.]|uniref:SLC13 family permease n=1 Tax=Guyparkeria sp. TaxID=2035736 RepID=UPI00397C7D15
MTAEQWGIFGILAVTLALFAWGRWRYDIVALVALLAAAVTGLVPADDMFAGLGHPAVVTVAAVLVLSRGLINAGIVDTLGRLLARVGDRPWMQVTALTGVVAIASAFINNVGALALFMPVAVWMAHRGGRSPSFLLMPLAFGSLLGGTLTMIGTPPNIIIAAYRAEETAAFAMFDFLPVGLAITIVGVAFIALVGWRLTPQRRHPDDNGELFEISAYLTELHVPEDGKFTGRSLYDLLAAVREDADVLVVGLVRNGKRKEVPSTHEVLQADDILLVEADSDSLKTLIDLTGLELPSRDEDEEAEDGEKDADDASESEKPDRSELTLVEAIITPGSMLVGKTASRIDLRERHGVNILAVARQGKRLRERIGRIRFVPGDILLLQGSEETLQSTLNTLGCLPLASRGLRIARPRRVLTASIIFLVTLAVVALQIVPAAMGLVGGALTMVLTRLIPLGEIYDSIDMRIIVLLAALLPVGHALETTGGSALIADGLLDLAGAATPAVMLAILITTVMLLSNVVNNAAAALLAAPVAIQLAQGMDASADPFLMAVAIGASCAFLTPIGHQSNTLVMEPGGYRFGDYWRMGLPLSLIVVAAAVPAILWIWPL